MTDALHARIVLEKTAAGRVGADRIALLRAVRDTGSLTAAAKARGLSYKAAWDAVQVLNNLFDAPLVLASAGGKDGGGSAITDAGRAVIDGYDAAADELASAIARLEAGLAGGVAPLLLGPALKTSARNALRGVVTRIIEGVVDAEVVLAIGDGVEIVATVTRESVADLGLATGTPAFALIKASFVTLAPGSEPLRTSARNCIAGTIVRREDGEVTSQLTLELTLGKTLTATLTRESADRLELAVGTSALAMIKASHVILAIA